MFDDDTIYKCYPVDDDRSLSIESFDDDQCQKRWLNYHLYTMLLHLQVFVSQNSPLPDVIICCPIQSTSMIDDDDDDQVVADVQIFDFYLKDLYPMYRTWGVKKSGTGGTKPSPPTTSTDNISSNRVRSIETAIGRLIRKHTDRFPMHLIDEEESEGRVDEEEDSE
jgi:hypothetical protein